VSAIVGVVLSYAALVAGAPGAGASVPLDDVCAIVGDACELARTPGEPTIYATPAEVDCSALVTSAMVASGMVASGMVAMAAEAGGRNDFQFLSSCAVPPLDFRYRVSRFPDSERSSGALGPQRGRRTARSAATATGLPPNHGGLIFATLHPMALYASTAATPRFWTRIGTLYEGWAPTRTVEPLDRPHRG
jgi:hypothetical protein